VVRVVFVAAILLAVLLLAGCMQVESTFMQVASPAP